MQVSVETTQGLERKLTVSLPADRIDSEIDKRLKELARTQRIPGFRPGKIPVSVIKKRFGKPVRQEIVQEAMRSTFFEAASQESLKPAGMPRFNPTVDEYGKDFQYEALFEIFPEVEFGDLAQIKIEKPVVSIEESDLDDMLMTLRKQGQKWSKVERAVQDEDKVLIDFEGTMDGEVFEGGSASGHSLVIGSNSMIPGFESGIIGTDSGAEVTLDLTFPEDYHAEALKGKAVQFKVTVQQVEEPVLPELNDDFAQEFGVKEGGLEALKVEVKKNMQRELDQTIKAKLKQSIIEQLLENNEVTIPQALIDQEVAVLRNQAMQRLAQQGMGQQHLPELPASLFEEQAKKRVGSGLIIGEIVKAKSIKVDQDKVKETVDSLASAYENPEEVVNWYYSNKQQLDQIEAVVLEDQVVEYITEQGDTTEKTMSFKEVMHPEADS